MRMIGDGGHHTIGKISKNEWVDDQAQMYDYDLMGN